MLAEDKQGAVDRASALARPYDAYPEIWLGVFTRTRSLPYFRNEAILIDSTGKVVWTFEKTYPVFGGESLVTIAGPGVVPMADAPYGRLSTVICNDMGYPGLLRQAAHTVPVPAITFVVGNEDRGRSGDRVWLPPDHLR